MVSEVPIVDGLKEQLESLEAELDKEIVVINGMGRFYSERPYEVTITVVSFGMPLAPEGFSTHILRQEDGGTMRLEMLNPCGYGEIHSVGEAPICEARSGNVWTFYPLNEAVPESCHRIFLEAVREAADDGLSERIDERRIDDIREDFGCDARSRLEQRKETLREEVEKHRETASRLVSQLAEARSDLEIAENLQHSLTTLGQRKDTLWEKELEQITGHSVVEHLTYAQGWLTIYTKPLELSDPDDPGRTCYLGRFAIRLNAFDKQIELVNLDNDRRGFDHPHVSAHKPCWGSLADAVAKQLALAQYGSLLDMAISYLQTYNPDDQYAQYASYWFETTPDVVAT